MSNEAAGPQWTLLHDYLSYYSLPDLRPDNIYTLATRLLNDESLSTRYIWDENRRVGA